MASLGLRQTTRLLVNKTMSGGFAEATQTNDKSHETKETLALCH